jgi:hypothetical protein
LGSTFLFQVKDHPFTLRLQYRFMQRVNSSLPLVQPFLPVPDRHIIERTAESS